MIDVKRIATGPRSCDVYVLPPFVVDAGTKPDLVIDKLDDGLVEKIDYLFLTHSHFDHVAGAGELKKQLDLKVVAHELTSKAVADNDDKLTVSDRFPGDLGSFEVDFLVRKEESIGEFEIILTPGHCDSSISLIQEEQEVGFIGDLFFPGARAGRTDLFTGSVDKLVDSLKRLSERDISTFFTGHGGSTGRNELELVIERLER